VCREIVKRLSSELEYYEAIVDKFRKKYRCTLEELEDRIKREGVPVDHEVGKTASNGEMLLRRLRSSKTC